MAFFSLLTAFHAGFLRVLGHHWETGKNLIFFSLPLLLLLVTTFAMHRWDGWDWVGCMACCDEYGYRSFEIGSTFAFARILLLPFTLLLASVRSSL